MQTSDGDCSGFFNPDQTVKELSEIPATQGDDPRQLLESLLGLVESDWNTYSEQLTDLARLVDNNAVPELTCTQRLPGRITLSAGKFLRS